MASIEAAISGKKQNYASSSESEGEEDSAAVSSLPPPVYDGMPQTGPKGVLMDYHRHLEEQNFLRKLRDEEKMEMIKRSAPTVKPRSKEDSVDSGGAGNDIVIALNELQFEDNDPFLNQYRARRLQEMKEQAKAGSRRKIFGNLTELRGDKFANAIDSAPPETFVVMHIYDDFYAECVKLNQCLTKLAKIYPTVKFCRVKSEQLSLSKEFQDKGLPALLVYKGGDMIGNHLNITDTIGADFSLNDVEEFLQEKNCLPVGAEAKIMSPYNLSPRHTPTKQLCSDDDD